MEYKVIKLEDMSSAAKRMSAQVVVDVNRDEKEKVKQLILRLIESLKHEKIEKPRTLMRHGSKPFEVVYIYLYSNLDEKNHGIPLARASYINPNCKSKPFHFSEEFIDENTTIKFDGMFEVINEHIKKHKVSDETFVARLESQVQELLSMFEELHSVREDYSLLEKKYDTMHLRIQEMLDEDFIGFPNDKYMDLYRKHQGLLAAISSIGIVTENKEFDTIQKHHLLSMYFEDAISNIDSLSEKLNKGS